jgi:hypothetical protein
MSNNLPDVRLCANWLSKTLRINGCMALTIEIFRGDCWHDAATVAFLRPETGRGRFSLGMSRLTLLNGSLKMILLHVAFGTDKRPPVCIFLRSPPSAWTTSMRRLSGGTCYEETHR